MRRRTYIDWLRGLAVLIMMEWHAVDAWTASEARESGAFRLASLVGGWAAPLFLFLAGVAVPLAGAAKMRKSGIDRQSAAAALEWRGWQVFGLAHLFRFQSFLFDLSASWSSIFKPDILNILGLGLVVAAAGWGRATTPRKLALYLLVPAAIIVLISPWSRVWEWPAALPPRLEAYIRPVGTFGVFTLFPWIAFVFIGAYVGVYLARDRSAEGDRTFHLRLAIAGLAITGAGTLGRSLPSPFAASEFWSTSISFFLIRVGVMTVALAAAWLWLQRPTSDHWSPLVVFGRHSLFVYWVHVALAYGAVSAPLHRALPLQWSLVAFGLLTWLMLGLAVWWGKRPLAIGNR
ncbi:MAG TPA: heparan-alpha-glucosaminide N-acetyltransferase domain-containing protein [Vicinamibacterales bacterium]|nr:heparan-alpha-glucosaminide N-acetyltransferase domain-containing protein [Vicinamibacterales bacterium]